MSGLSLVRQEPPRPQKCHVESINATTSCPWLPGRNRNLYYEDKFKPISSKLSGNTKRQFREERENEQAKIIFWMNRCSVPCQCPLYTIYHEWMINVSVILRK